MAKITELLNKIMSSRYGRDVRSAIHDSIKAMNKESETAYAAAITAKDSAQASATAAASSATNAYNYAASAADSAISAAESATILTRERVPNGTDLNTLFVPEKRYYAGGSHGCSNVPDGVDAFALNIYQSAAGYITQELYSSNSGIGIFVRNISTSGEVFSDWKKIGFEESVVQISKEDFFSSVPDGITVDDFFAYMTGNVLNVQRVVFKTDSVFSKETLIGTINKKYLSKGRCLVRVIGDDAADHGCVKCVVYNDTSGNIHIADTVTDGAKTFILHNFSYIIN